MPPINHEDRMEALESVVFGPRDAPHEGHVTKVHELSNNMDEIRETLQKINWLIIAGVLVGILNLVLTKPAITHTETPGAISK